MEYTSPTRGAKRVVKSGLELAMEEIEHPELHSPGSPALTISPHRPTSAFMNDNEPMSSLSGHSNAMSVLSLQSTTSSKKSASGGGGQHPPTINENAYDSDPNDETEVRPSKPASVPTDMGRGPRPLPTTAPTRHSSSVEVWASNIGEPELVQHTQPDIAQRGSPSLPPSHPPTTARDRASRAYRHGLEDREQREYSKQAPIRMTTPKPPPHSSSVATTASAATTVTAHRTVQRREQAEAVKQIHRRGRHETDPSLAKANASRSDIDPSLAKSNERGTLSSSMMPPTPPRGGHRSSRAKEDAVAQVAEEEEEEEDVQPGAVAISQQNVRYRNQHHGKSHFAVGNSHCRVDIEEPQSPEPNDFSPTSAEQSVQPIDLPTQSMGLPRPPPPLAMGQAHEASSVPHPEQYTEDHVREAHVRLAPPPDEEANSPTEDSTAIFATGDRPTMSEINPSKRQGSNSSALHVVLCCLCLVVIGVGVAVPVALKGDSDSDDTRPTPTLAPTTLEPITTAPTSMERFQAFFEQIQYMYDDNPPDWYTDPITPQYQALHWLANTDPLQLNPVLADSDETIQLDLEERYLAAVLYFATGANREESTSLWDEKFLSGLEVCDWNNGDPTGQPRGIFCGDPVPVEISSANGTTTVERRLLRGVVLSELKLSGTLPEELGFWSHLGVLSLNTNTLAGTIPTELGKCTALSSLSLRENELTGNLSSSFLALTNLQTVELSRNGLGGEIPSELGSAWKSLSHFACGVNQFEGELPSELGLLSELTTLTVGSNLMATTIPTELGQLTALSWLEMSMFGVSGEIPIQLGQLTELTRLEIGGTSLGSSIPTELGLLSQLRILFLAQNGLTGTVPTEFANLSNLRHLEMHLNDLSGDLDTFCANDPPLRTAIVDCPIVQCSCCTLCW